MIILFRKVYWPFGFQSFLLVSNAGALLLCLNTDHLKGSDEVGLEKNRRYKIRRSSILDSPIIGV